MSEPGRPPIAAETPNRRALVLPGGGMRVAYQAGAVKALHERGLRYSFADGASGGTMNLAALLGGASPDQLCTRWRSLDPLWFVSLRPLLTYLRPLAMGAYGDFDGIERRVFPHLGIDAAEVRRATGIEARFNVADFDDKVAVGVPHREISHALLLAGISLPLATPPVRYRQKTWTDAVWIRDSWLTGMVQAGANEIWLIWCIGNTPQFSTTPLGQYVHMIELSALGWLNDELARIAQWNREIAAGGRPFGHDQPIVVHVIAPQLPIPLDPDFLLGKIDAPTLVSLGYADATRYLDTMTAGGTALTPAATKMRETKPGVAFRETMAGRITLGETDPVRGSKGPAAIPVALHGSINVDDIAGFVRDPRHEGRLSGWFEAHRLGGWLPAGGGTFGLFTPSGDPRLAYMVYDMRLRIGGRDHYLQGRKHVAFAGPWRLWGATTTLHVTLREGTNAEGPIVAAGVLRLGVGALLALLATFTPTGSERLRGRIRAAFGFFGFFASELVRIYLLRRPA